MKTRRYIKNIILECMNPEGCHSKDLIDEVSKRVGKPLSIRRISSYLSVMFSAGEVSREPEIVSGILRRYKWFRSD